MAGKRKIATKTEIFYIQNNPENKNSQELADELSLFRTTVEKILLESPPKEEIIEVKQESQKPKINKMEGFITSKSTNGKGGVAVMQEAGSSRLDDFRRNTVVSNDSLPYITKTRPEQ